MRQRRVLSSLDLLPEEAREDVLWAMAELNKMERFQSDILDDFNERLASKGLGPISKSAFNRRAVRLKNWTQKLEERRHLYSGIAERLTPEEIGKTDIVLSEFLKVLIDELSDGVTTPKGAMELARAYRDTVTAQKSSADHRRQMEAEARAKLEKAVGEVAGEVERAGQPVDAAQVLRLIRKAYGIEEDV
ncbi:DUF3486 family protein [Pelagibacterium halotolerans]|uniref:Mu-like phage gp27 n=1 Tax=Pelagibacterium halotolerans (strain DSM 22347 / JCM 15775 / CGMCC 1.7692 / B2) TaxID=1082931 RepID=G4RDD8_PELHB|nr:DUF3486 family protein [Pelagibacterium halotolerans]AEQ50764.1 Mu-like phage gp27 [Pelagibacterium halotolerans B2]QJR19317.1 DUF3486 family protein [Pelagibacterium halotolerans]SDZ95211.1 Protein of unknown function [Pelagibacterium halotolerans]